MLEYSGKVLCALCPRVAAQSFVDQRRQPRIAVVQPVADCDAVCLVLELTRAQRREVLDDLLHNQQTHSIEFKIHDIETVLMLLNQ